MLEEKRRVESTGVYKIGKEVRGGGLWDVRRGQMPRISKLTSLSRCHSKICMRIRMRKQFQDEI